MPKVLFVCSRNRWRSPTAEALFRTRAGWSTRSAGTGRAARVRVSAAHLRWAEVVCCMEHAHAKRLREMFPAETRAVRLVVLGIADDYRRDDPELVARLTELVPAAVEASR